MSDANGDFTLMVFPGNQTLDADRPSGETQAHPLDPKGSTTIDATSDLAGVKITIHPALTGYRIDNVHLPQEYTVVPGYRFEVAGLPKSGSFMVELDVKVRQGTKGSCGGGPIKDFETNGLRGYDWDWTWSVLCYSDIYTVDLYRQPSRGIRGELLASGAELQALSGP